MDSDESLITRAREGDDAALTDLVERYAPRVLRFGLKLCRDEEDAREVLQDTLLTAARRIRSFRGESRFATWLYTIARSFCIKLRTRGASGARLASLDDADNAEVLTQTVDQREHPDERLAGLEIGAALERGIRSLDPAQREVLVLRDVEGLSAREVADVLGVSVEAAKSRLHRARQALRERLAPLFEEPPRGPDCPDVVQLLSRHLEGDITAAVCHEMEAHVDRCEHCASRCASLRQVLSSCSSVPEPVLPPELRAKVRAELQKVLVRSGSGRP